MVSKPLEALFERVFKVLLQTTEGFMLVVSSFFGHMFYIEFLTLNFMVILFFMKYMLF